MLELKKIPKRYLDIPDRDEGEVACDYAFVSCPKCHTTGLATDWVNTQTRSGLWNCACGQHAHFCPYCGANVKSSQVRRSVYLANEEGWLTSEIPDSEKSKCSDDVDIDSTGPTVHVGITIERSEITVSKQP